MISLSTHLIQPPILSPRKDYKIYTFPTFESKIKPNKSDPSFEKYVEKNYDYLRGNYTKNVGSRISSIRLPTERPKSQLRFQYYKIYWSC